MHQTPRPVPTPGAQPLTGRRQAQHRRYAAPLLSALAAAVLMACSGGGDSTEEPAVTPPVVTPPAAAPTRLVGVAAIGAPMAGASVVVSDADASTANATATALADGSYSVDVSALKAPLLVTASGTVNGEAVKHVAVLASVAANADNTANVTPLTTAITALVAPLGDLAALATPEKLAAAVTATQVSNATTLVVNTLKSDSGPGGTAGLLPANFNPITTAFKADGTGADAALTRLDVAVQGANVVITNNAAAATETGNAAPATLTPALVATPSAAPTLSTSVADGNIPTQAEMDTLGVKIQACLALPINQRVVQDASGTVTAVLGACNFAPADWKSNGRNFAQDYGQLTLAYDQLTGSKVGAATVVLALAPEGLTDAKAIKHPTCNTAHCAVVAFPLVTASGKAVTSTWQLGKVGGQWNFVGNQRPGRYFVEPRLVRYQGLNPSPDPATNAYFNTDRVESVLRLIADPSVGDNNDIRAVRVTGPGLPAAGVVMQRSQRCLTDDRLAITRQDGSTRVPAASNPGLWAWTTNSGNQMVLAAAKLDGTPLAMPVPNITTTTASSQEFLRTALANPATTVPAWSRYKFEFFYFGSATPDTPDEYGYARAGAAAEHPGTAVAWPAVDAAALSARVSPTGTAAGAQTSFADSISWTQPAGLYVSSGYLFGQNTGNATNSQGETTSYVARARIDYHPLAYGDVTGVGFQFGNPRAGTALSTITATSGTNPNPRCAAALPALGTTTADYREMGLSMRSADRQLRQAIWFWRN